MNEETQNSRQLKWIITVLVLLVSAFFLFARLGHYALWDDEANTALIAQGVWQTGDTSAVVGDNLVAFRDGWTLKNLHERATPPLSFYLTAPFIGLLGETAWAARLPFALCGFGTVLLILRWLWRDRASVLTWVLVAMGLLGNVSFFLFNRQCRYYALVQLLTTALAYLYFHFDRPRKILGFALLSVALLAANYLAFAAFWACLAVDFALCGRKRLVLSRTHWLSLSLPQLALGLPLVWVWNPWATTVGGSFARSTLAEKMMDVWWSILGMSTSEFGVIALLVIAPLLFWRSRDVRLWRIPLALAIYLLTVSLVSPLKSTIAEVRYYTPTIPLWIYLGVVVIQTVAARRSWLALVLGVITFGSNFFQGGWFLGYGGVVITLRSTPILYLKELLSPPGDPYTVTAGWINQHLPPKATVAVVPDYMMYPLMFHAPKQVYAWQLKGSANQFPTLPRIHFEGEQRPDYIIIFGPMVTKMTGIVQTRDGTLFHYDRVAVLNCFWRDLYRPELFLRTWKPVTGFDPGQNAIYIFRRTEEK